MWDMPEARQQHQFAFGNRFAGALGELRKVCTSTVFLAAEFHCGRFDVSPIVNDGIFAFDDISHGIVPQILMERRNIKNTKAQRHKENAASIRILCGVFFESADFARGLTYAVVCSATGSDPAETRIGEFEDEFRRTDESWRIFSRRARFVMHT